MSKKPQEFTIKVQAQDPEKKEKPDDKPNYEGSSRLLQDSKEGEENELSEEDQQLKDQLEMLVERLKESNKDLYRSALESLRTLIRTSTSSMTSVPKPLKFLRPHFPKLQELYETWEPSPNKSLFADILSVLAMTYSDTEPRGTLRYRLLSDELRAADTSIVDPSSWGHEYIRHLSAELGEEYNYREEASGKDYEKGADQPKEDLPGTIEDLRKLGKTCATFLLRHNAEPDAVDLMQELEIIKDIIELVDENTYSRVCQYMIRMVHFLVPPDDKLFLRVAHDIYVQHHKFPEALALSLRLNDPELIREDFNAPGNPLMKRQLAFLMARSQVPLEWLQPPSSEDGEGEDVDFQEELPEDLLECLSNARLSHHFREFGKEVGVAEAKSLEDVYKSHLENTRPGTTANIDSARGNLAGTFVNAFVNAGFGNDKLMVEAEEGSSWIYKNKDHGMLSAAASLGLSLLWDTDIGLSHVDKYTYSSEENIKAGALLATGILNTGVRTEADAALALLGEYVENNSIPLKTSAIIGLGLAYAGSHREDLLALLLPLVEGSNSMEILSLAALALGFIFVGSGNGEITGSILQTLMEKAEGEDKSLDEKWTKFLALGLGLLYLGLQDASDATVETLKAIEHPASQTARVLVEACSWAGSTNVLKVQSMLGYCYEHIDTSGKDEKKDEKEGDKKDGEKKDEEEKDKKKKDDSFQAFAVIGISLIAMGEEIGSEMILRQFNHLMHYGEPVIRRSVPLAIGLVSASNPQLPILDTLSKYSHDNDLGVALNAIFAMGLVGSGTNNARLAQMLRQLAGYYQKEPDCLFMVRIAQGLVHMGKGTIGLNPFYSDRSIMSRPAVAGLLATLTAFTDAKGFVLDKYHWMLYFLTPAMYPRFLITLDEELNALPTTVRVGQAVDVVGQAGKPRTISGFQTHTTPVRMGITERAELATEEYIPFAHVLEGFVILQKNPGYDKDDRMDI
ncbi:26S proteasome subunit RPN2a [Coprinopsis cinerea AmutBmut pab1-1]|nr:26S proteasome subunit RPN2a [Coprinopsis cinerea AmutBmut pab1-1]